VELQSANASARAHRAPAREPRRLLRRYSLAGEDRADIAAVPPARRVRKPPSRASSSAHSSRAAVAPSGPWLARHLLLHSFAVSVPTRTALPAHTTAQLPLVTYAPRPVDAISPAADRAGGLPHRPHHYGGVSHAGTHPPRLTAMPEGAVTRQSLSPHSPERRPHLLSPTALPTLGRLPRHSAWTGLCPRRAALVARAGDRSTVVLLPHCSWEGSWEDQHQPGFGDCHRRRLRQQLAGRSTLRWRRSPPAATDGRSRGRQRPAEWTRPGTSKSRSWAAVPPTPLST